MKRVLPSWALLLLGAIFLVGAMFWVRANPSEPRESDDPVVAAAQQLERSLGLSVEPRGEQGGGVRVTGVKPGSPAEQRGLQAGDVIIACADRSVWHAQQLAEMLGESFGYTGQALLLVKRGEEYHSVRFGPAYGMRPGQPPEAHSH